MRAGELGMQDEAEMGVKFTLLFSNPYVPVGRNKSQNVSRHLQLHFCEMKQSLLLKNFLIVVISTAITCSVRTKVQNISFQLVLL